MTGVQTCALPICESIDDALNDALAIARASPGDPANGLVEPRPTREVHGLWDPKVAALPPEDIVARAARLLGLPYKAFLYRLERASDEREPGGDIKILTSCPSCLQGLSRYRDDAGIDADYIVVEMAKHLLGAQWMENYVEIGRAHV